MSGMYPKDQVLEIFGEHVRWPGLGQDGKFTNGSFTDPLVKPSFIPAETLNLLVDNMQQVIEAAGLSPNNIEPDQLLRALQALGLSGSNTGRNIGNVPYLEASDKRKITIKAGTQIKLGTGVGLEDFFPKEDVLLSVGSLLDTGTLSNGKDYYYFLYRTAGGGIAIIESLNKDAPQGLNLTQVKQIGGLHTLCNAAGNNMTYEEGGETKTHPLNGFGTSDVLPHSVWCLNHRPFSEPEGMVYISSLDFWCDIYLPSGSGNNTKSVYQGAITHNRQYVDCVEDMFCVKKELLDDAEFSAAMLGSNEQTAVAGANEAGATSGGAGGRLDTAGRRMISIYGIEEGCGSIWQWLKTTSAGGVVVS